MTAKDATNLARLMGITCSYCGGQVRGRKGYMGVFLGCANYPDCRWTKDLAEIV
jgi:ssDNA-binding Zn-finger/Zn-ribbon topoisomerase 1